MRRLEGFCGKFVYSCMVVVGLFHLYTSLFGSFEAYLQRNLHLGMILPFSFLLYPASARAPRERVPLYDWVLFALAFAPFVYSVSSYQAIIFRMIQVDPVSPLEMALGVLLVVLLLEAARRVVGAGLVAVCAASVAYMLLGHRLPGPFRGMFVSPERVVEHLYLTGEGIFSSPLGVSATMVIVFLILGGFLQVSGIGDYFMDLSRALAGRAVGGPAKIAVVSSALFGSISGSAVANVYATGSFTIPMMRRLGFSPVFAGAVEAVASSGGQIMPPVMGAGAFIMASFLGVPYRDIMLAALLPAFLYYLYVFQTIHFHALKSGLKGLSDEEIPSWGYVLRRLYLLLPVVVLVALILRGYTPMKAAIWAIALCALVSVMPGCRRMGLYCVAEAIYEGMKGAFVVAVACAAAGIVVGAVTLTGLGFKVVALILKLAAGIPFLALVMVMVLCIILGMGLPTTAAYIVASAVAVPALVKFGFSPLSSHMFVFYFAVLSAITPPVALAAYAASSISGADPSRTGYEAFRLGLVGVVIPFVFSYDPGLLASGGLARVAMSLAGGLSASFLIPAAFEGFYFYRKLNPAMRSLLGLLGFLSLSPQGTLRLSGIAGFLLVSLWGAASRRAGSRANP